MKHHHFKPDLSYDQLMRAKPEYVRRLARALGVEERAEHRSMCVAVVRWLKRNHQPRVSRR